MKSEIENWCRNGAGTVQFCGDNGVIRLRSDASARQVRDAVERET